MKSDTHIRLAAFDWLTTQVALHGDVLPRTLLEHGFEHGQDRIPLLSPQGIFKPRQLDLPLSITTAPHGPYDDSFSPDGYLLYRYRGTDPGHRDNVGLRRALVEATPLVYCHGLAPGRYLVTWPVYIIGDDAASLTFKVAVDDVAAVHLGDAPAADAPAVDAPGQDIRRAYITTVVRQRLHQRAFRERVLSAYQQQCAICRLRHYELLDAAHLIPDREPEGVPQVRNGVAMCKLHHAAFDAMILGITPDYTVEVRQDVLREKDGPMLLHGIQDLHGSRLVLPRDKGSWPNPQALDYRYLRFTGKSD